MSIKGINNVGSEMSNDATLTGNLSANAKLLSDLTPPVTPDSTPMSIGNSPNFKQQPQSFLLLNQSLVTKKHVRISSFYSRNFYQLTRKFQQLFLSDCYNILFLFVWYCCFDCVLLFMCKLQTNSQRKSNIPHQTKCRNGTQLMMTIFSSIWMVWTRRTIICHKWRNQMMKTSTMKILVWTQQFHNQFIIDNHFFCSLIFFLQKIHMLVEIVESKSHQQFEKAVQKCLLLKVFRWLFRFLINATKMIMKR